MYVRNNTRDFLTTDKPRNAGVHRSMLACCIAPRDVVAITIMADLANEEGRCRHNTKNSLLSCVPLIIGLTLMCQSPHTHISCLISLY